MSGNSEFQVSMPSRVVPGMFIVLGAAAVLWGLNSAPERTWPNLLVNGFYFASLGVSAIFFLATQRLTGARWSAGLRRIPEALMLTLPVAGILLLLVFLGRQVLYKWSGPGVFLHEPAIAGKVQYLQSPWILARMILVISVWTFFAWLLRRTSLEQDRNPGSSLAIHHRLTRYTVLFTLAFALTFTLAAFDWIISLEPQWFSTMFAVYVFAGTFVQGIAAITLGVVLLRQQGFLRGVVGEDQLHDLGKMLFAFSTFWAYIWTCQYLLIWYGNIPEEVTHYVKRTNGPWVYVFALNFVLNWVVPFCALLSVRAKRNPRVLIAVTAVLLAGHWLDLYVLIMPSIWSGPKLGILEILIAPGYAALCYLLFVHYLSKAPLVPVNDPILNYEIRATAHEELASGWAPGVK